MKHELSVTCSTSTFNAYPFKIEVLSPPSWGEYELIDSGDGRKLERFGPYRLIRPEAQAIWSPSCSSQVWDDADAVFQRGQSEEGPGDWTIRRPLPEQWLLHFDNLAFWARLTPFRHTGVFPEHSALWSWLRQQLMLLDRQPSVLVLFGYTGLTTLVAAHAGARVCHVDASRPAVRWAKANQEASGLEGCPVRWIVDDVSKFIEREIRRGSRYDMIIMDPPIFGRGPKGQVWRLHESLRELVMNCVQLLSERAVGMVVNAYATTFSSVTLYNVLQDAMCQFSGEVVAGELVLVSSSSRFLSSALFAFWQQSS